jgi:Lon protease-like protein
MERLPLFPLRTVLFPGALIPLHVFEERYKLMIGRCLERRSPFGVVLIKAGEEVGGWAEPHPVGTTARPMRVRRLPDGRLNLVALGRRRFRIVALDRSEPYLCADVEELSSEGADTAEARDEAARVAALFGEHYRLVLAVTDQWVRRVDLPGGADALADFAGSHLDVPPETKQELLETLSVAARLRAEAELLGERIRALTERWSERREKKFAGALLN